MKKNLLFGSFLWLLLAAPALATDGPQHDLTVRADHVGHAEAGWRIEWPQGLTVSGRVGFVGGDSCELVDTKVACTGTDFPPGNLADNISTATATLGYTKTLGDFDLTVSAVGSFAKHPTDNVKFKGGAELEVERDDWVLYAVWNHAVGEFVSIESVTFDGVTIGIGRRF